MSLPATRASAPCLSVVDGIVTTLSTHVAAYFGKRHDDVLRAIRALIAQLSPEHGRNFAEMLIDVAIGGGATRQSPAYRLTRDGFTLLAMGFTGKKALAFKLAYIDAFNRMEAQQREQQQAALPAAPARVRRWLVCTKDGERPSFIELDDDVQIVSPAQLAEQRHQAQIDELRRKVAQHEKKAHDHRATLFIYEKFKRPGDRTAWLSHVARAATCDWYAEDARDELRRLGVDPHAVASEAHPDRGGSAERMAAINVAWQQAQEAPR